MKTRPYVNNQESLDRLIDENSILRSALEKTGQGKELVQQREEFSLLLAVSKLIVSELNLDRVLQLVADKARDLVQADMLLVPMLNEERDRYVYVAASGNDAETVRNTGFPVTVGMCGWVLRNERSLLFGESSTCWLDEMTAWENGQQSAVLVPLFGRKQIIGGLSALGKTGGGGFSQHDLDLLTMFANQVSAAIENAILFQQVEKEVDERRRAEERIRGSLREKEVLLKEIHHRVKNNMQVIYSLLNLQAKRIADRTVRAMFEESRNRVSSMALIHEKLYRSEDLAHIDFKEYLQSLVAGIADTYKRQDIVFSLDMEQVSLDVNVGIPCGLIVNELVSNSLKHAFPGGRKGTISVGVNRSREGFYVLTVADNGVGFPPEVDFRKVQSLGLQLVNVLAGQINGTFDLSNVDGARFSIVFPESQNVGKIL